MKNDERMIVRIINEICHEESIDFTAFSYDWILRLQKGDRLGFVFGYNFGSNNATSARICDDKSAASDILIFSGVPTVEHLFFMAPGNIYYVGEDGNWDRIESLLRKYHALVCKANVGSGGNAVFLVKDQVELENAVHKILSQHRSMAISPFYDIIKEYRIIVLCGHVKLVYAKNIPCVVGDGVKNLRQLLINYMAKEQQIINIELDDEKLDQVLHNGETWNINWKSNLGQGASPELIESGNLYNALSALALQAAKALSIDFASIDIVQTPEGLKVLEVNCGIMMENFIRSADENYGKAKAIYREAVEILLGGNITD
jgi:glutathione synthase/RimK-type ligase-like ATP-grasp enzyme